MIERIARRVRKEALLAVRRVKGKANSGYCTICDRKALFVETGPWHRDEYLCVRCGSIPRQRALIKVLNDHFPGWREARIHESSPGGPSSDKIRRECREYVASQYFANVPRGQCNGSQRSEDLERLTFGDECFDIVLTQDVFEHVLRPTKAFAEIARTLKPGGAHVYTVPYYRGKQTVIRAEPDEAGGIRHVLPPDYHQNPIDAAGSLVITEWGDELCDFIFRACGMTTTIFNFYDPRLGLKGEFLDVLISRKAPGEFLLRGRTETVGRAAQVGDGA